MAVITQLGNYVKFLRGTPNAYQLATKDPDTLYFISENDADRGVLYLGEKLISGSLSASTSLADLTDVLINAGVSEGSLLVYDGNKWVSRSLSEILEIIIGTMVGATASQDGETGTVPAPHAGDQNKYLRGDGTWANPTAELETVVTNLSDQVGTLIDNDVDKSVRDIAAEEVNKIVDGAPAAFDTLREVAAWIVDNQGSADLVSRVATLEDQVQNESTGLLTIVDVHADRLTYLDTQIANLKAADTAFNTRITNLETTLKWQDMVIQN